jgi:hypothetical protein
VEAARLGDAKLVLFLLLRDQVFAFLPRTTSAPFVGKPTSTQPRTRDGPVETVK